MESCYKEGEVDISLKLSGTFSLKGSDRGEGVVVVIKPFANVGDFLNYFRIFGLLSAFFFSSAHYLALVIRDMNYSTALILPSSIFLWGIILSLGCKLGLNVYPFIS